MKKVYAVSSLYSEEFEKLEARQEEFLFNKESFTTPWDDDNDEPEHKNYQVVNGLALYSISGKMMSSGNIFTRIFGIPTYDAINDDLVAMAQDEEVEKVLIDMATPGGHVGGLSDISDTWSKLNSMKPITVHTPSHLASAGVWLASNSDGIYASEVAEVGSIGVVLQHVSYQQMLEKDGIKVTNVSSSPKKTIGTPTKNLSSSDEEYLQKKVDEANGLFQKQLYTHRPAISAEAFSGEMFSAGESLRLGLIDGIQTYSNVFEQLLTSLNDSSNSTNPKEDFSMRKKVTQSMAAAAISAGADPNSFEIVSQAAYDALSEEEKNVTETPGEGEAAASEGEGEGETAAASEGEGEGEAAAGEGEGNAAPAENLTAQVEALTGSLSEAQAQVETLTAQVADLEGQLEAAASDPLRKIAEERIAVMRTALGMVKIEMSDFTTKSILAEYNALDTQFKKAFKPGGTVKVTPVEEEANKDKVTHIDSARLGAVGVD